MSTRITTQMIRTNVLSDLQTSYSRMSKAQAQLSSGKLINRPSDDPYGTSRALSLRTELAATKTYQANIKDGQGWQDETESALSEMNNAAQTLRTLLVQSQSDSNGVDERNSIADQVVQLIDTMKQAGNASYGGKYIFSGNATDVPPYQSGTVDTFAGDSGSVARQIGPGVAVAINTTGDTVLGSGGGDGKLLDVARNMLDALRANNADGLRGMTNAVDNALDGITTARATNGAKTNRFESALTRLDTIEEATNKQLTTVEDADYAKTIIDYTTQQAAYQAALKAGSQVVQSSLMDFLN